MTASTDLAALRAARDTVVERIASACARSGRDPASVQLLAVSKGVSAGRLGAALSLGLTVFGENRVQEAEAKASTLPEARWELVGRLQSNKARRASALFEAIHSVDSVELARRVSDAAAAAGRAARYPIYLQVNVDSDPHKAGFAPADMPAALEALAGLGGLDLRGLMTIGQLVGRPDEGRPTFVALRNLSEQLRARFPALGSGLSMGMSDDFEVAVEEGATVVRIGRAIFGPRR